MRAVLFNAISATHTQRGNYKLLYILCAPLARILRRSRKERDDKGNLKEMFSGGGDKADAINSQGKGNEWEHIYILLEMLMTRARRGGRTETREREI